MQEFAIKHVYKTNNFVTKGLTVTVTVSDRLGSEQLSIVSKDETTNTLAGGRESKNDGEM
jgi:hypothetical protein